MIPCGTWDNLGQCWRKPHYCLYLSSPQIIFVSGCISFWSVAVPISDKLSCGVRWDNATRAWWRPPEELRPKSWPAWGQLFSSTVQLWWLFYSSLHVLLGMCKAFYWGNKTILISLDYSEVSFFHWGINYLKFTMWEKNVVISQEPMAWSPLARALWLNFTNCFP